MTIQGLYRRARQQGIEIDHVQMRSLPAVSFPEGWIAIDRRRTRDDTEYKCVLAHEIGHIETGSFYNIYSSFDLREKNEYKANKRAVEILMPLDEVKEAISRGYTDVKGFEEYFDVTTEMAEFAFKLYENDLLEMWQRDSLKEIMSERNVI